MFSYAKILKYGLRGEHAGVSRPQGMDSPVAASSPMSPVKPQGGDYATQASNPKSLANALGKPRPMINSRTINGLSTPRQNDSLGIRTPASSSSSSSSSSQGSGTNPTAPTQPTQ